MQHTSTVHIYPICNNVSKHVKEATIHE